MNLFILSSFATGCLAAGKFILGTPHCEDLLGEVDSLQDMIRKRHPEALPTYLVSKSWDKNVATAFALGLVLGKQCNILKYMHSNSTVDLQRPHSLQQDKYCSNNSSSADCVEVEYEFDKLRYAFTKELVLNLKVNMKNFQSVISANFVWKDLSKTYNPFDELFNIKEIQNQVHYNDEAFLYLGELRRLFANHAKCATAMIVIDVTILKCLVHAVNTRPQKDHLIVIDGALLKPLCALSMHVQVREHCKDDILTVLNHVQHYAEEPHCKYVESEEYTTALITLFKFLDDGPIRSKVGEIITKITNEAVMIFEHVGSIMLLGFDHPFIKAMKEKNLEQQFDLIGQLNFPHKTHSMGNIKTVCFLSDTDVPYHKAVRASIEPDDTLTWEGEKEAKLENKILKIGVVDDPQRLLIFSEIPVPNDFWEKLVSCTTMPEFLIYLESPTTRRMILTYGIIILETNPKVEYN